ncbi:uncharacterized protein LOC106664649 isoform X2 [Cimex lectularius]|nr:uncharacterized protein LOC106664649 isoform X2 [Cimex lectularius]
MNDKTSWKNSISQKKNVFIDSDCEGTECERENLLRDISEPTTFCANCCSSVKLSDWPKFKRRHSSLAYQSGLIKKVRNPYLEELELKLMNDELIERELCDKQIHSRQQLEDISDLLRTISLYVQSLETRLKLSRRIYHLLGRVLPDNSEIGHNIKENSSASSLKRRINEALTECADEAEMPEVYYEALCDCNNKYRDFTRASANFCRILQNPSTVTNSQLRKLEKQYEIIRSAYSESKALFNIQMDQLIESKVASVDRCLQTLIPSISETIENDKEIFNTINELSLTDRILKATPDKKTSNRSINNRM